MRPRPSSSRPAGWASSTRAPRGRGSSTEDELIELGRSVEIGGHTVTHPDLTTLSRADAEAEMRGGKEALEGHPRPPRRRLRLPVGHRDGRDGGRVPGGRIRRRLRPGRHRLLGRPLPPAAPGRRQPRHRARPLAQAARPPRAADAPRPAAAADEGGRVLGQRHPEAARARGQVARSSCRRVRA